MILYFTVDKNKLNRDDDSILASYSRNINKCVFCCEDRQADIYKYALFTGVLGEQYIQELGFGKRVSCKIPNDILKGNYFSVSIFGGDRFTTTQQNVLIQPSGFTDETEDLFESGKSQSSSVVSADISYYRRFRRCRCRGNIYGTLEHPYI